MAYVYTLTGYDDEGNIIVEHDVTPDEAVVMLVHALKKPRAVADPDADAPTETKSTKKIGKGDGRKKRVCSICGRPGHDVRKCPDGKGQHPDNPRTASGKKIPASGELQGNRADQHKQGKIRELLQNGHDDDYVAAEALTSPRVVAFIRKQMVSRGEL